MNILIDYTMGSVCSYSGKKIFTCIAEFPRPMLAEFLTHRVFNKNTSSSRAIPVKRAIQITNENPYMPEWTQNQSGMVGALIEDEATKIRADKLHLELLQIISEAVAALGYPKEEGGLNIHKQDASRYLEAFQHIRMIMTTTEIENFLWLRNDVAAYPPIRKFAEAFEQAYQNTDFQVLKAGEWHLPMIKRHRNQHGTLMYLHPDTQEEMTLEKAKELSMSLSAQTSFRRADSSEGKTQTVNQQLFKGEKVHASPSEHQATPFSREVHLASQTSPAYKLSCFKGLTGIETDGQLRSGSLLNWCQLRQLLPNHDKAKF